MEFQKRFTRFVDTQNEPETSYYKDTQIIVEREPHIPETIESPNI